MRTLIRISLLLICCSVLSIHSFGQQTPYLEKNVTIRYGTFSYAELFKQLSQQTGVVFSYTTTFDDNRKITVQYNRKPLRIVLNSLFNEGGCTYKQKGKYIIISCKPVEKPQPVTNSDVIVNGYVYNAEDSTLLPETSVYLRQNRQASVTNEYGYFSMGFTKSSDVLSVSIAREGYRDTTIVILARQRNTLVIYLEPEKQEIPEIPNDTVSVVYEPVTDSLITITDPQEEVPFDFWSRMRALKPNLRNIKDTMFTHVSFSLVPPISTNRLLSLNTVNDYSFNVLAGSSRGVNLMEIGGLVNIDAGNVKYLQLAGIANLVSGNVMGVQGAGIVNTVYGNTYAVQAAGIVNLNRGDVHAVQLAGIGNVVDGNVEAVQAAGIFNQNMNHTEGVQMAGIANSTRTMEGTQISGFVNRADSIHGVQIAGFGNYAKYINGFQVAGFINRAGHVQGSQFGVLNFARSTNGVPVGFFSFVRTGYHKIEFATDEHLLSTASFRTGVNAFHNIFIGGMQFSGNDRLWTIGYGLGTSARLSKRWYLDFDVTSQQIELAESGNFDFNQLTKAYLGIEWRILKKFSIAAGPTFNWFLSDINGFDHATIQSRLTTPAVYESITGDFNHRLWVGGKVALRFL